MQSEETSGGSLSPAPTGIKLLEIQRDMENYNDMQKDMKSFFDFGRLDRETM